MKMNDVQQIAKCPVSIQESSPAMRPPINAAPSSPACDLLDEIANYEHVPLSSAGTRRVHYGRIEPLRPREYQYDEDEA
jgi:hypothetical protein